MNDVTHKEAIENQTLENFHFEIVIIFGDYKTVNSTRKSFFIKFKALQLWHADAIANKKAKILCNKLKATDYYTIERPFIDRELKHS